MPEGSTSPDNESLARELERYKRRCSEVTNENAELKDRVARLESANRELKEELLSLKTTVSAVVARSIDAKADTTKHRYKKPGRREGHEGASRSRPEHIDATVELDQPICPRCGGALSEKPTDSYTRVVEDVVPAKVVVTEYVVRRRYCRCCRKQVSPPIPDVIGGGNKERFGLRLMLLVVSLKMLGLSYEKIGAHLRLLFDLDQSNVLKDIRMLEPLVRECVPIPKKLYEGARRASTLEEVELYFPGFKAFIDSTEQEIPRPKRDARKRNTHYSGKKKRHTVKTQLTVNSKGLILHKTNHARGRRHGLDVYRERHPDLPKEVQRVFDLGYKGVTKDFPALNYIHPFKRRGRGGRGHRGEKAEALTPEQKRFNRELSRARVVVEHTISRVKKFNVFGQEFRNRLKSYNVMTDIVSGLVNLRIIGVTA